jgi:uncharacterized membrane protein HdeD (DUF308 family)
MKKHLTIYFYSTIILGVGIFMLNAKNSTVAHAQIVLGLSLIIGSIFAFVTAFTQQKARAEFTYLQMHAFAMLSYGVSILLIGNNKGNLIELTAFLFFFYAFSEVIFSNWLFNLAQKKVRRIVLMRVFLGLIIGVGTIFALNFTQQTLPIFGFLFILIGINSLFYIPVMKTIQE